MAETQGLRGSMRFGWNFAFRLAATAMLAAFAGCGGGGSTGGGGTPPASPTITSVAVSCSPASILTSQTSTCTPTVGGTGSYSSVVTWSVSPTSIGAVSSAGVFTPAGAGTATITATSTQDSTKSGSATVTVTAPPTITSVSVVCSPTSILTTQTSACTPTVAGTGSFSTAVTWSVSPSSIGAVSSSGVYTPSAAGTATITASSTQDTTKSGSATVVVTVPPTITSVSVICSPTSILTTQTSACTPTVAGTGSFSTSVTWSVSPTSMGAVSSAGVFTPAGAGTATITAISTQDSTKSGTATVTVAAPAPLQHGALLASPPLYASSTATTVTLSIWLPDSDLNAASVTAFETDQNGVHSNSKGALNDSGLNGDAKAGDKVYTLQFGVTDASPTKHYYAVSYKSISSGTTYSTEIDSITSVPIVSVSDATSYSLNMQDSITRLVNATSSYQAIYPTSTTAINQTALDNYISTIISVLGNIQQLSSYDSANPMAAHSRLHGLNSAIMPMGGVSNFFWSLLPFGLGDILKKNNELAPEKQAFLGSSFSPNDPAVAGVMAWLAKNPNYEAACDPDITDDAACRAVIWPYYAESPDAGLLEAAASSATSFGVSEYTGLAEDGAGDLLSSQTDLTPLAQWSIEQGAGIATDYFADNYTAPSGRQMLVLGNVSQGQTTMLPNGSHDIILASSSTRTETPGIVSPAITSLLPASLQVGAAPGTLTINGTGFLASSTVTFNGVGHTATFVSASQLTIPITASDLATVGTYPVVVTNPAPGGGASASVNFTVSPGNPVPSISSLLPASLQVGAAPGTLTINGTGFLASSTVTFNGVGHTATFVSASQLTISLTSSDLATAGTYPVVVTNPAPGGGASAAASFSVTSAQASGLWTWMSGSNTAGATDVFGTEGVPDPANVPGARTSANSWTDNNGNFWLLGGIKHNYGYGNGENDLWEFNPSTAKWTWVSGNQVGVYGTVGVPDASNLLPGRSSASSWIDGNGKLWVYGGLDFNDTDSNTFYFNDLWDYDPSIKEWTWVSGASSYCDCGVSGTQGVPDTANVPLSRQGAISWTDSSGNLWLFGGSGRTGYYWYAPFNDLWKYNPTTNEWTWVSGTNPIPGQGGVVDGVYGTQGVPAVGNIPGARYDAVSWTDSNGKFWLFGGAFGSYYVTPGSLNDLWEFNPTSGLWTWVSGANIANQPGFYSTLGVPASDNVPGARSGAVSWSDNNGNFWLFGGNGLDSTGQSNYLNDLWMFNLTSKMWTCVKGNATDISTGQVPGVYGTVGIPAATNSPGGRSSAVSWVDKNGALWLFGGYGYDSTGSGYLNDLWRYQP